MGSLKTRDYLSFLFYKTVVWIAYHICFFFFRIKIFGREKVLEWKKKNNTPFIAVARHRSLWDAVFMPIAFGGFKETMMNYITKEELSCFFRFVPFFQTYFTFVNRKKPQKSVIEKVINLLEKGTNIGIFPEGTTIPEFKAMKRGVLLIIKKAEQRINKPIPIFPLNIKIIQGQYGKPRGKWIDYVLRKVKIELRIGEPIFIEQLGESIKQNLSRKNKEEEMIRLILEQVDRI